VDLSGGEVDSAPGKKDDNVSMVVVADNESLMIRQIKWREWELRLWALRVGRVTQASHVDFDGSGFSRRNLANHTLNV